MKTLEISSSIGTFLKNLAFNPNLQFIVKRAYKVKVFHTDRNNYKDTKKIDFKKPIPVTNYDL